MIPDVYRPSPKYPTYPPYHVGLYLEDYFYGYSKTQTFSRTYIPIFWTTLYCDNHRINIQHILDRLPKTGKYFTVCQHDDAPRENLPPDTLIFSSGGHFTHKPLIALPSICSKIENPIIARKRDIFCSFRGSLTHPLRDQMIQALSGKEGFVISHGQWRPDVPLSSFEHFKDITERSEFALCPRGYGRSSCRMYEAMQLGAIPVYVSDLHFLPWEDELNWNELCVLITPEQIPNIEGILRGISSERKQEMRAKIASVYDRYFSLQGVCEQITKRVGTI